MNEFLMIILIISILYFLIKVLITLEDRVIKKIRKEAEEKGIEIIYLREPGKLDGKNPFGELTIWVGASSRILGVSGEQVYNKIAVVKEAEKEATYWVKVRTTFFIPSEVNWKKLK